MLHCPPDGLFSSEIAIFTFKYPNPKPQVKILKDNDDIKGCNSNDETPLFVWKLITNPKLNKGINLQNLDWEFALLKSD